jgi:hypothetical protein
MRPVAEGRRQTKHHSERGKCDRRRPRNHLSQADFLDVMPFVRANEGIWDPFGTLNVRCTPDKARP